MKAVRVAADGSVAVVEAPVPRIGPGEALVKTRAVGICGSDLLDWYVRRKAGSILGHEVAGEVVEVGSGVENFAVGDRIVPHHHAPCGRCEECRNGRPVHCAEWRASALDPGGMAEFIRMPAGNLARDSWKIPPAVTDEEATFVEPLATVVKAFRRGAYAPGDRSSSSGSARRVSSPFASRRPAGPRGSPEPTASRRGWRSRWRAARRRSWTCPSAPIDGSAKFDFVFVGPGKAEVIESALEAVAPGGTLLLFTMASPEEAWRVPARPLLSRDRDRSVVLLRPRRHARSPRRDRSRRVRVADLVSHRFGIERAPEAFARAARPRAR